MRQIEVVAAVIVSADGRVLATERGYGDMAGGWEFPGGKVEPGESNEQALRREIREELGVDIDVEQFIATVEHDYPQFHLTMHCYRCRLAESAHIELREHHAKRLLPLDHSLHDAVDWLPADRQLLLSPSFRHLMN